MAETILSSEAVASIESWINSSECGVLCTRNYGQLFG